MIRAIFKKWDYVLVAFIFISLICIFYAQVIFFGEMFIKRDIGRYYHPLRLLARQQFEAGGFPFWNPYLFCGIPLFATIQSCVLYPVSIINYLGSFSRMFNCFILFHLFLAGIFMYLLMRDWRLSRLASFLASFSFAFGGYMIGAINLTISLSSAAWFPLLLLFYRRAISPHPFPLPKGERVKGEGAIFSAFTLVMMLLAGDPAIVYISIIALFCISSYLFLESLIEKKIFTLNHFKPFFSTLILFLLLSAFQTLPFLEYLRLTDRKNMPWWVVAGWSVPPTDLISLVIPFFNDINWYFGDYWQVQSWLDNYYMGLIPLLLCFIGAFFDKTKKTSLLILFSVFSLVLVLGKYTIVYPALYKFLPFFKFIRYPVRFFFLFTFSVAALSGIGLDFFRKNIHSNERLKRFGRLLVRLSFLAVILLGVLVSSSGNVFVKLWNTVLPMLRDNDPAKNISDLYTYIYMDFYNFNRALMLFALFGVLFFLGAKGKLKAGVICLAFVGIAIADVTSTNLKYEYTMNIKTYTEPTENIKFLHKDKTLFRIAVSPQIGRLHTRLPEKTYYEGVLASKDRLVSNRMIEYGIYDIGGYDSMYLSRHNKLLEAVVGLKKPNDSRLLDMLNVKYVCVHKTGSEKEGYQLANKTKNAFLFENLNFLPRAYLAKRAVVITKEDKILERLKDKAFEPTREVILEESVPFVIARSPLTSPMSRATKQSQKREIASLPLATLGVARNDAVEIVSYKPNEVIIKAIVDSSRFLILADSYYPGWKVYVDGKQGRIYRANYILRAVYLKDPGVHIVRFIYDPFSFKLGVLISLTGLIFIVIICKYKFIC